MKRNALFFSTLISVFAVGNIAQACDYHNGFTNNGFANHKFFGANHALQQEVSSTPRIKLQYPYFNRVAVNKKASVMLSFQAPEAFSQINIALHPTEQLDIKSDGTFATVANTSSQTIEFQAKKPGRHSITIKIDAMLNEKPYSLSQKIYINAKEAS